jgi:2-iminobutanoate/2-iminopropanoate deaminase
MTALGRAESIRTAPTREVIHTDDAPKAVGPYSQAIRVGDFVYTAGQVGINPASGKIEGTEVKAQTHQVIKNLTAILTAAGTSLNQVVKTTVFLASMEDFAAMNSVYAEYFSEAPPARSTVEVSKLPLGALVEIEVVALLP